MSTGHPGTPAAGGADASARWFEEALARTRVVGVFRGLDVPATLEACATAWDAGVEVVEVTVQRPDALPSLRAAVAAGAERGLAVGAGTVTTAAQVADVADAGAAFTVAPGLAEEVVAACAARDLPHLPGVATATEVTRAVALGCTWLKAFPASQLGPGWVRAQHGPFPDVRFVATGGVDAGSAPDFLRAGCRAVGLGSTLGDPEQLALLRDVVRRRA